MKFATTAAATIFIRKQVRKGIKLSAVYAIYIGDACVYVGQSRDPHQRGVAHRISLRSKFKQIPTIKILEVVPRHVATKAESKWIQLLIRMGEPLINNNQKIPKSQPPKHSLCQPRA